MNRTTPSGFIAVQECAAGNGEVGNMWLETRKFPPTATLAEVWEWSQGFDVPRGRLIITQSSYT